MLTQPNASELLTSTMSITLYQVPKIPTDRFNHGPAELEERLRILLEL